LFEADETFAETRAAVLGLLPRLVEMNDKQKVKALMDTLHVPEDEANDIIEAAKAPVSRH
jgi:hypothetical protein